MDEQLISEVEKHEVIYNRQKCSINSSVTSSSAGNGTLSSLNKYETKDGAWHTIALKLRSDVETCKKRWKYLRERYVSQRKQGDPPVYEHLSRPYLEKMKFLDQYIQPRKSYRNVSNFLSSPNANSTFTDYNMDSSKSNGSAKNHSSAHQQQQNFYHYQQEGVIKTETDNTFGDFVAAVASQHLQQINSHNPQFNQTPVCGASANTVNNNTLPSTTTQSASSYDNMHENRSETEVTGITSSTSSSIKSPMSSSPPRPQITAVNSEHPDLDGSHQFANTNESNMKKPRVQMSGEYLDSSDSDNNFSPVPTLQYSNAMNGSHPIHLNMPPGQMQRNQPHQHQHQPSYNKILNNMTRNIPMPREAPLQPHGLFPTNNDMLLSMYHQMAAAPSTVQQERSAGTLPNTRTSEHLLGELVTSELLKMNKDRRKNVQKRILEILFFED